MPNEEAIIPAEHSDDILRFADSELASRIAYAQQEIAQGCYRPSISGIWHGRDDVLQQVSQKFNITLIDAAQTVDLAVMEWADAGKDTDRKLAKNAMRTRLVQIRQVILRAISDGRKEMTYKYEKDEENPRKVIRVPMKEKVYNGTDMTAVSQLLAVEKAISNLDGLDGIESTEAAMDVLSEINKTMDDGSKQKVATSLSYRIKNMPITELSQQGQRTMQAALEEMKRPKKVQSKVVEQPEDDEDAV